MVLAGKKTFFIPCKKYLFRALNQALTDYIVLFPKNTEEKLNFEIIRRYLADKCESEPARKRAQQFAFSSDFDTVVFRLQLTQEMKDILLFEENFPLGFFPNNEKVFSQKQQAGSYFKESELMELRASMDNIRRLSGFFHNSKRKNYPQLKSLLPATDYTDYIINRINSVIDRHGEMKDTASSELKKIRRDFSNKTASISKTLNQIIARASEEGIVEPGTKAAMREGKLLIPVSAADKRKIKGIVYDISASGQTGYIEPYEVTELNNEIRELEMAEKREMIRILSEITQDFRPYFPDIITSYNYLSLIDFIRAKAKLALELDAVMPDMQNAAFMRFRKAGHPLLLLAYKNKSGKNVVRSDIFLNDKNRMMVISGPNAGGKSVALKTAALLQYMLQSGLLVPVKQSSEAGIFENIFIDIGDEQSVEDDLSTYSSHLLNMKYFTENADENTLVLIDEMGSGTEPHSGAAIAEAVLEALHKRRVKAVITTHYANLKAFAENTSGAFNAAMLFDRKTLSPLYELETEKPGSSFAFEIAEKTGLSPEILHSAKNKTDNRRLDFEKVLKKAMDEKRRLRKTKRKLRAEEDEISRLKDKYRKGAEFVLGEKKKILQEARDEAQKILQEANKKIENTIAEIRKAQADKATTRKLREELENFKEEYRKDLRQKEQKVEKRLQKVSKPPEKAKSKPSGSVGVGDIVKIKGQNSKAEVIGINAEEAEIALGNLRMTVKLKDLIKTGQTKEHNKKSGFNLISDEGKNRGGEIFGIDIRGKRADEAVSAVRNYIDNAMLSRTRHIKILHGTGNGILRQVVREYLTKQETVKSFGDERTEAGGSGITLAELDI